MRYWILITLCNLLSVCALMIIFSRREKVKLLMNQGQQQRNQILTADAELTDRNLFKGNLQKLVDKAMGLQGGLQAEVTRLTGELKLKSKDNCITAEASIKLERENKEKELSEIIAHHKSEVESLEAQLNQLKMQWEQRSEICKYVKPDKYPVTLCGATKNKESKKDQGSPKDKDPVQ